MLIPNNTLKAKLGKFFYGLGVAATLGMSKYKIKWVRAVWDKVVEPYIVDFIDNILVNSLQKFTEGLRSDNGDAK